tara:strand:+ start:664 stop:1539 length:876 start_codon:yes stop_codon:yes gene_type:complete
MTGYGVSTIETDTVNVSVEIKTLNSKFMDIYCRIPRNYSEREIEIRNLVTQKLERGKAELTLTVQPVGKTIASSTVNRALAKVYFDDLAATAKELGFEPDRTSILKLALQLPNAYNNEVSTDENKEDNWVEIKKAILEALDKCNIFREQEGQMTGSKLHDYIQTIEKLLVEVNEEDTKRIPAVRERIRKQIKELVTDESFDQNRFEQELIYYMEKFDISEEKIRLQNHLNYFNETLQLPESNGKKLNFISQEIGREVNTMGSKANDSVVQHLVVRMKDELEKIKEQTLNII